MIVEWKLCARVGVDPAASAGASAYGSSPYYIRLPHLLHTVTAPIAYGYHSYYIRLHLLLHTVTSLVEYGYSPDCIPSAGAFSPGESAAPAQPERRATDPDGRPMPPPGWRLEEGVAPRSRVALRYAKWPFKK